MPKLFLIPTPLNENASMPLEPSLSALSVFVVENAKSARASLKKIIPGIDLRACEFLEANEHTDAAQWSMIFQAVKGRDIGLLSEAGMPCVADPGNRLVRWAHEQGYKVIPLVGPNAIVMALAASGLSGQRFSFHGYLPRDFHQRVALIKALEKESLQFERTQIFIEAPHHNDSLFIDLVDHCQESTLMSISSDLTGSNEQIMTKTVAQWRKFSRPLIDKIPTVFLIQAMVDNASRKR